MKKVFVSLFIFFALFSPAVAQNGYEVRIQFKDALPDTINFYLYRGSETFKYKLDSGIIIKPNELIKFSTTKKILGGVYRIDFGGSKTNSVNIVLDNNKKINCYISGNQMQTIRTTDSLNSNFIRLQKAYLTDVESETVFKKLIKKYPGSAVSLYAGIELKKHWLKSQKPNERSDKTREFFLKGINLADKRIALLPNIYGYLFDYVKISPINDTSYTKAVDGLLSGLNCTNKNYFFYLEWIFKNISFYQSINLNKTFKYTYETYLNTTACSNGDRALYAKITRELAALSDIKVGSAFPNITMQDSLGNAISLTDLLPKAQYSFLAFFDPECDHCKIVMPEAATFFIQRNYPPELVQLIGFRNVETREGWSNFIKNSKMDKWLNVEAKDNSQTHKDELKLYSNPKFFLLDNTGKVKAMLFDKNTIRTIVEHGQ